jgi:hypothetical protein
MAKLVGASVGMLLVAFTVFAQESTLSCEVVDDGIEKIKCTFVTSRKDETREAVFHWHSESHPQDDRERNVDLPPNHGSVYDYRYLRGRAQGIWTVEVTLTDGEGKAFDTSHRFLLEDNRIVNEHK